MQNSIRIFQGLIITLLATAFGNSLSFACDPREPTRATGMGPHYVDGVGSETLLWRSGEAGEPVVIRSRVVDTCGDAISGARVRLWHANQDGEHSHDRWRSDLVTDERGTFDITTVMPGYAGGLARHIHFIVSHPGHEELVTRVFFGNDPYIEDLDVDDLALRLELVEQGGQRGWITGYEFVLKPI